MGDGDGEWVKEGERMGKVGRRERERKLIPYKAYIVECVHYLK